jgi:lipid II:glycine glycyltransferase (peptidoglycan interpeptide bridge formation enzyme)
MNTTGFTVRLATPTDKPHWNTHAQHPLQSWEWGEFRAQMGIDVVRLIVEQHHKIVAVWQLTFHPIPHTRWTIGYFPKGPAISDHMIEQLTILAKQKNAICIQLEPNIKKDEDKSTKTYPTLTASHRPLFTKYTFVLDLTPSEESLLQQFHSKTRYNIKVAQKHGVTIQEDNSPEAFAHYLRLNHETTTRQGFYAHSNHYHQTMWDILHPSGLAKLFTATYNNTVLATWVVFVWNKILYYPYGASSREHRETMAPTLMLWEISRWAKQHHLHAFDLWGALGPTPDPHDPWFGFHRFKQGFNPTLVEYVGSFDLVTNPLLYRLYTIANTIRWAILARLRHN